MEGRLGRLIGRITHRHSASETPVPGLKDIQARSLTDPAGRAVYDRMKSHPEEFGVPFVPFPGTEGERLVRQFGEAGIAAGRTTSVGEVQDGLGLPRK
jgi:hypothetical protein